VLQQRRGPAVWAESSGLSRSFCRGKSPACEGAPSPPCDPGSFFFARCDPVPATGIMQSCAGNMQARRSAFSGRSRSASLVVRASTALPKQVRHWRASAGAWRRRARAHGKNCGLALQFKSVKPVGDRVFVKVEEPEARTMGGVLLPTTAQKRPTAGAIVALGDADTVKVGSLM